MGRPAISTRAFLAALILSPALLATLSVADDDGGPHAPFTSDRMLIRLDSALGGEESDGTCPAATGITSLDRLLAELSVERIRSVVPIASRDPARRDALASHGLDRTYVLELPEGTDIAAAVDRAARIDAVVFAEPDYILTIDAVMPDDPQFGDQWGLHQDSDADVDAPEAWDIAVGTQPLAFLDTGIDSDHEEFIGRLLPGYDLVNDDDDPEDDNDHGTSVTSIATARTDNGLGMAGVCWDCPVMSVKVMDADGTSTTSVVAEGYIWATDHGARIINYSGGTWASSQTMQDAVQYAYAAGVILVSSVGNYSSPQITYPGRYAETIAVGGTDQDDRLGLFSDWGPELDVVAPGETTPVATIGGYGTGYGTSLAAPIVTGLLGIMRAQIPSLGREEARHLVRAGAEDQVSGDERDVPGFDEYYGWGRVNLERALLATRASSSLRVTGTEATVLEYDTGNPLATSYDFVRGDIGSLSESSTGVEIGTVTCLENDSADASTVGDEDTATPAPGSGVFYLGRFNVAPPGVGAGSYGGSTQNRDRLASAGDCSS